MRRETVTPRSGLTPSGSRENVNRALIERLAILLLHVGAGIVLFGGFLLAVEKEDFHWMNRAGAGIVVLEGFVMVVEFFREERLKKLERYFARKDIAREEGRTAAERTILEEIAK